MRSSPEANYFNDKTCSVPDVSFCCTATHSPDIALASTFKDICDFAFVRIRARKSLF